MKNLLLIFVFFLIPFPVFAQTSGGGSGGAGIANNWSNSGFALCTAAGCTATLTCTDGTIIWCVADEDAHSTMQCGAGRGAVEFGDTTTGCRWLFDEIGTSQCSETEIGANDRCIVEAICVI